MTREEMATKILAAIIINGSSSWYGDSPYNSDSFIRLALQITDDLMRRLEETKPKPQPIPISVDDLLNETFRNNELEVTLKKMGDVLEKFHKERENENG